MNEPIVVINGRGVARAIPRGSHVALGEVQRTAHGFAMASIGLAGHPSSGRCSILPRTVTPVREERQQLNTAPLSTHVAALFAASTRYGRKGPRAWRDNATQVCGAALTPTAAARRAWERAFAACCGASRRVLGDTIVDFLTALNGTATVGGLQEGEEDPFIAAAVYAEEQRRKRHVEKKQREITPAVAAEQCNPKVIACRTSTASRAGLTETHRPRDGTTRTPSSLGPPRWWQS